MARLRRDGKRNFFMERSRSLTKGVNGYYKSDVMHWFCKPSAEFRTHHLHLVPVGSSMWVERLAFRDHLRADASARIEYAALKDDLATRYSDDREAYTDGKTDFVRRMVALELQQQLRVPGLKALDRQTLAL